MDSKLRDFLRRRGIADSDLDKIERGVVPADDDTLGKQTHDNPLGKQCDELLREIKSMLDDIAKADEARRSLARGLALSKLNGAAITLPKEGASP